MRVTEPSIASKEIQHQKTKRNLEPEIGCIYLGSSLELSKESNIRVVWYMASTSWSGRTEASKAVGIGFGKGCWLEWYIMQQVVPGGFVTYLTVLLRIHLHMTHGENHLYLTYGELWGHRGQSNKNSSVSKSKNIKTLKELSDDLIQILCCQILGLLSKCFLCPSWSKRVPQMYVLQSA